MEEEKSKPLNSSDIPDNIGEEIAEEIDTLTKKTAGFLKKEGPSSPYVILNVINRLLASAIVTTITHERVHLQEMADNCYRSLLRNLEFLSGINLSEDGIGEKK